MSFENFLDSHFFTFGFAWAGISVVGFFIPVVTLAIISFQRREHMAIAKRRPQLSLTVLGTVLIYGALAMPANWFYNINAMLSQMYILPKWQREMIHGICLTVYCFGIYGLLVSFTCRTWLIHFDVKFSQCLVQSKWVSFIRTDENEQESFYIKYKSTLGSYEAVKKFMWISLVVLAVVEIVVSVYYFHIEDAKTYSMLLWYDTSWVALTVLVNAIIRAKTPYMRDEWDISLEISYILRLQIPSLIGFGILIMSDLPTLTRRFAMNLLLWIDTLILSALMISFGLYYTQYNKKLSSKCNGCSMPMHLEGYVGSTSSTPIVVRIPDNWIREQLMSINSLNSFMEHLMNEFSHENLLFVIETNQFRNFMIEKHHIDLDGTSMDEDIPQSSILSSQNLNDAGKANELFLKYVQIGAIFEVNISWDCRRELCDKFSSGTYVGSERELATIFDDALAEVLSLMGDSCRRFSAYHSA